MSTSHLPSKGSQRSPPLTSIQPFIYPWFVVNILGLLLVRIPFWCLYYIPSSMRPNPAWTWNQALMVRLAKFNFTFSTSLRPNWDVAPKPGRWSGPKETFEVVEPASSDLLQGVTSPERTSVRATQRPATWYPTLFNKASDDSKLVVLYFTGGAYVLGGHTANLYQKTWDRLLPAINGKYFSVGYRFASNKGSHFPTQLVDAISAYQHLLSQKGIPASRILLVGDSAGGNLVLALLRYMVDHPTVLPLPSAAVLACPWTDLTADYVYNDRPLSPKFKSDSLDRVLPDWGANGLIPGDMSASDPYLSPSLHPFHIPVPLWVTADANEVLYDTIAEFVTSMKKIPGNDVDVHYTKNGVHDLFVLGDQLGFPEWVASSVESLKTFLSKRNIV